MVEQSREKISALMYKFSSCITSHYLKGIDTIRHHLKGIAGICLIRGKDERDRRINIHLTYIGKTFMVYICMKLLDPLKTNLREMHLAKYPQTKLCGISKCHK